MKFLASDKNKEVFPPTTRVAVQHPKLTRRETLQRCFDSSFLVFPCQGPFETILLDCQRMAPCVLLLDEECLLGADSNLSDSPLSFGLGVRVLVLGRRQPSDLAGLLHLGCWGFLRDDAPPAQLRSAVRAIDDGEIWAPRKVVSHLLQTSLVQLGPRAISRREMDILRLITEGTTNRQIAERLCISYETVRWHIRSLYSKIGVRDRLGAVICGKGLLRFHCHSSAAEAGHAKLAHLRDVAS